MLMTKYTFIKTLHRIAFLVLAIPSVAFSQHHGEGHDEGSIAKTFSSTVLMNDQTVEPVHKNAFEFIVQHRFGQIKNEKDLFGIFGDANLRFGLGYGLTKNLTIGVGASKFKSIYDFEYKYLIIRQGGEHHSPVSVCFTGDLARSASAKEYFIDNKNEYHALDRFSYTNELLVARRLNDKLALQAGFDYTHVNIADEGLEHDHMGMSITGTYKLVKNTAIMFEYDLPFSHEEKGPKADVGLGCEISTEKSTVQVFICGSNKIIHQEIRAFNQNEWTKEELFIGFNITRHFTF